MVELMINREAIVYLLVLLEISVDSIYCFADIVTIFIEIIEMVYKIHNRMSKIIFITI